MAGLLKAKVSCKLLEENRVVSFAPPNRAVSVGVIIS